MAANPIKAELNKHFNESDFNAFAFILRQALHQDRAEGVKALAGILNEVNAMFKLKIVEFLVNDGQQDTIPLLVDAVQRERNDLYTKQLIYLLGAISHPGSVKALHQVAPNLSKSIKPIHEKVLTRQKERFAEHTNMIEFAEGVNQSKLLVNAANQMLAQPHPNYIPFLNRHLNSDHEAARCEAVRVLTHLGDKTSLGPLFGLLRKFQYKKNSVAQFINLAHHQHLDETFSSREVLVQVASALMWDEGKTADFQRLVFTPKTDPIAEGMLDGFEIDLGPTRDKLFQYYRNLFSSYDLPMVSERKRILDLLEKYRGGFLPQTVEVVKAMANIAGRFGERNFYKRIESTFPEGTPDRNYMLIAALSGLKEPESIEKLCLFLDYPPKPEMVRDILEALLEHDLEEIPRSVVRVAAAPEHGINRRRALRLLARSSQGEKELVHLLSSPAKVIQADVIRVISENKLMGCYHSLLELLKSDISDSLCKIIMVNLRAFPGEETGDTLQLFMCKPYPLGVRMTAMKTVFEAGGPNRMALIIEALGFSGSGNDEESLIEAFVDLLHEFVNPETESMFMEAVPFWGALLNNQSKGLRKKLLALLRKCKWDTVEKLEPWLNALRTALIEPDMHRGGPELESINILILRVSNHLNQNKRLQESMSDFDSRLEALDRGPASERLESLRKFDKWFMPEVVARAPEKAYRLARSLIRALAWQNPGVNIEAPIIKAMGRLGHPMPRRRITPFLTSANAYIRKAAEEAMDTPLNKALLTEGLHRLLAVDPHGIFETGVKPLLHEEGFELTCIQTPKEALQILNATYHDLLLLDPNTEPMDGLTFLQEARNKGAAPEFVMVLSDRDVEGDVEPFYEMGIDGIILNPFKAKDVLQKLRHFDSLMVKRYRVAAAHEGS